MHPEKYRLQQHSSQSPLRAWSRHASIRQVGERWRPGHVQGMHVCPKRPPALPQHCPCPPRLHDDWPPRAVEDTRAGLLQLLVAGHLPLCCQLCGRVQCLQLLQVLPDAEGGEAYPKPDPNPPLGGYCISVDTIRELPESKGYNAILVVVDRLSKHIHAMPTITTVDSAGVVCLFLEHVWRHHGLPEAILSDRGSAFISNFSRELAALLNIQLTPSTAYHPQTDRQTDRASKPGDRGLSPGFCEPSPR